MLEHLQARSIFNPNWSGTPQEYYELYRVTANHLKTCFPDLKIGGFASTGFYEFSEEGIPAGVSTIPTDNIREGQTNHTTKFIKGFFEYITSKETKAPIDFFSWHFYGTSVERAKFEISENIFLGSSFLVSLIGCDLGFTPLHFDL